MRENVVVSKVVVRVENSDGTHSESTTIMPHDIADHLHARVIGWSRLWRTTFDEHDAYREEEKKFLEKLKNENK